MIKGIIFDMWGVLIQNDRTLIPGATEILQNLAEEYQLGISTSISRSGMDEVLKKFGINELFSAKSSGSDVEYNKPNIDVYTRSQELMGLMPGDCVVVEDTKSYLAGLKAAGFYTILKGAGECDSADAIISDLSELQKIITSDKFNQ